MSIRRSVRKLAVASIVAITLTVAGAGAALADSLTVVTPSGQTPVTGQRVGMCLVTCPPMSPFYQGAGDPGNVVTFGP
jgi:hypothetical protein